MATMADVMGWTDHPAHASKAASAPAPPSAPAAPRTMADVMGWKDHPAHSGTKTTAAKPVGRPKVDPAYTAAVSSALGSGIADETKLDAIGKAAVAAKQKSKARTQAIRKGPMPTLSTGPHVVGQLAPAQAAIAGPNPFKQGNPFSGAGTVLGGVGDVLSRPESAAAFGAGALADLIKGKPGQAAQEAKNALRTFTPGGPVTSISGILRSHGVDPGPILGTGADILGDPLNFVFPEALGARAARTGGRLAEAAHAAEVGAAPGEDALSMTARHVVSGGPAPQLPSVPGTRGFMGKAEDRLAKARANLERRQGQWTEAKRAARRGEPMSPGKVADIGRKMHTAERKLSSALQHHATQVSRLRKLGEPPPSFNEAETFIDHAAQVGHAEATVRAESPIGFRVNVGAGRFKKGVDVPLAPSRLREPIGRVTGPAKKAFASRYAGRTHAGTAAAIQARDQFVQGAVADLEHRLREMGAKHGLLGDEAGLQAATFHAERTATEPAAANVQALADEARAQIEQWQKEMEAAGIKIPWRKNYMPVRFTKQGLKKSVPTLGGRRIRLPGEQAFMRERSFESVRQAVDQAGTDQVEQNILKLLRQRGEEQIKTLADAALQRTLVRRFGRVVPKSESAGGLLPMEGAKYVSPEAHVDPEALRTYSDLLVEKQKAIDPAEELFSALTPRHVVSAWKRLKLMTPAYDIRNARDEAILAAQSGVNPITAARHGRRLMAGRGAVGGRSELTSAEARYIGARRGVTQSGMGAIEYGKGKGLQKLLGERGARFQGAAHRARIARENVQRGGSYATLLRRGMSPAEAARAARTMHFDYADPGTLIERWRTSVTGAPFGTWLAKNLPRQVALTAGRPGQAMAYQRLIAGLAQQAGLPAGNILPSWVQEQQPIPIPGAGWWEARTPMSDLNTELPTGSGNLANLIGSFAPLPQAGAEIASGIAGHPFNLSQVIATGKLPSQTKPVSGIEGGVLGALGATVPGSTIGPSGTDIGTTNVPRWLDQAWQLASPSWMGGASRPISAIQGLSSAGLPAEIFHSLMNEPIQPFNAPSDWAWAIAGQQGAVNAAKKGVTVALYNARANPGHAAQIMQAAQAQLMAEVQKLAALAQQRQAAGAAP